MSGSKSFVGGNPFERGHHAPPYSINLRQVTLAEYRRQFGHAFGDDRAGKGAVARSGSVRGRKAALSSRKKLTGCDHEFEYHEEHEDYGCYGTNTSRWLECAHCNEQRAAGWDDAPAYDEEY